MTDAPNSVSEFGWGKPHSRRTPPWSTSPNGAWLQGIPCGDSTPIFFCGGKKKTAVELSKEKTLVAAQLRARDAPCRAAGCGSKLFCSVDAAPTGARAGLLSDFRTFCAVLHSEGIGQRSNLTSCSFRAFRFAKRCPGGRGWKGTDSHVAPLLGMTENACHCEEARRVDAAIRIPRLKGSLV